MRTLAWYLYYLMQGIVLCVWSVTCIIVAVPLGLFTLRQNAALYMARVWAPNLMRINGIRWSAEGGESIDYSKPHIYVLNHQSMLDICVGYAVIPTTLRFVSKQSLKYVPFLGWYMWATGMIFVDRGRSTKAIASLNRAGEKIRAGASIIAFPEGTRSRDGRIHAFKKGIFRVALEAGVPIVPVAVIGTRDILPADGFRPRPGTVRARIGEPIDTSAYSVETRNQLIHVVREALIDLHLEIGGPGGDRDNVAAARAEKR